MRIKIFCAGFFTVILMLCLVIFAGCTGGIPTNSTPAGTQPIGVTMANAPESGTIMRAPASVESVTDANNQFAFEMYSQIAKKTGTSGRNIFFSPFSVSTALAITYEGARGKTADEIGAVFHFPKNEKLRQQGFSDINAGINTADSAHTLRTANALWAEKSYPFLPDYRTTARRYYHADTTNLDFINDAETSRAMINTWVENRTENRIRDLIPPGVIDVTTRLVITNAVYFKGTWEKQFDKHNTIDADFRTAEGKTVTVAMMQRTDENAIYRYAETPDFQFIVLPYTHSSGRDLSMLVILPKAADHTVTDKVLDSSRLSDLEKTASLQRVNLYLPKFHLETEYRLPETLAAMGMPTAFSPDADFSGMDGTKNLYIGDVVHKAFIDVNEEGTEAAASTAVIMQYGGIPDEKSVPEFRADHPFFFLIKDNTSGTILFFGNVQNPGGL